ncbi:MAG: hypothetical protein WAO76_04030 [Georgfuchsia sp.]
MKIVVCIKPTMELSSITYDTQSGKPVRSADVMLSDTELAALQAAFDQKKQLGAQITVLSVADERSDPLLRQALLAGADRAIRLWHSDSGEPLDTYAAASAAAAAATTLDADLVICGVRSADMGSEFFPITLATAAHYELVPRVLSVVYDDGKFNLIQKLDNGWRTRQRVKSPAVIAVETEITRIRHNTVLGRTYRAGLVRDVERWTPQSIGLNEMPGSLIHEMDLSLPRVRRRVSAPETKRVSAIDLLRRKKQDGAESKQQKLVGSPENIAKELLGLIKKWSA